METDGENPRDPNKRYSAYRQVCEDFAQNRMAGFVAVGEQEIEYFVYFNGWDWCASNLRPHNSDYMRYYIQNLGDDGNFVCQEIVRR